MGVNLWLRSTTEVDNLPSTPPTLQDGRLGPSLLLADRPCLQDWLLKVAKDRPALLQHLMNIEAQVQTATCAADLKSRGASSMTAATAGASSLASRPRSQSVEEWLEK